MIAEAEDFDAISEFATDRGFAGTQYDERNIWKFPLLFNFTQINGTAVAEEEDGFVGVVGDEVSVGSEVENGVGGDACVEGGAVKGLVEELGGVGDGFGEDFDFGLGVGEGGEWDCFSEDVDVFGFCEGGGENAGCGIFVGFEWGEGEGGEVVDLIVFSEPLFAVVEGCEGDVTHDVIGGIDDRIDVGGFEFGFDRLNDGLVEFLGDGFDEGIAGLELFTEGFDFGFELVFGNGDGFMDGGTIAREDDEF